MPARSSPPGKQAECHANNFIGLHLKSTADGMTYAELGVPHQSVKLDLSQGDQRKPEFLALNPNGKVPTITVDGAPMFEALAIELWLGHTYGVKSGLWPAGGTPGAT